MKTESEAPIKIEKIEAGILRVSLQSSGFTGQDWTDYFYDHKIPVGQGVRNHLLSDFTPTTGIVYNLILFNGQYQAMSYSEAVRKQTHRKLANANIESACLLKQALPTTFLETNRIDQIIFIHQAVDGLEGPGADGNIYIRSPRKGNWVRGMYLRPISHLSFCGATSFACLE